MNAIAAIIVLILIVDFILHVTADVLNLRQLRGDLPVEFEQWYNADQYRKSQAYLRVNTRFGWVTASVNLMVLFAFWFVGGFAYLDQWVRSLHVLPVISGLIFFAAWRRRTTDKWLSRMAHPYLKCWA
jgi:STE24 endopeptidase